MGKANISNYRRGYKIIDIICQYIVIGGVISGICGIIAYANYRDNVQFKKVKVSCIPYTNIISHNET